jgi:hypothetical protein
VNLNINHRLKYLELTYGLGYKKCPTTASRFRSRYPYRHQHSRPTYDARANSTAACGGAIDLEDGSANPPSMECEH